ncbi:FAD-dependent tricarballylate dehydrogenase TcuA [Thiohalocapsa marina]|uniref:FAD-dependent tricarballylate dehydrogenase TcuA n=2 Tax=Thiohalocapsa marina TaxID=424902 RepID=A0A5M8FTD7_9GAMM|nr:FAD-dependent tricarballylate dehydrogenase TcuA [Thiohalocapsa marina]
MGAPGATAAAGHDLPEQPDVLVVGGGTAALCAAIAARRGGAGVLLLEQAPRWLRGGNTRHSRNLRIRHEVPTPLSPGCYDRDEFCADLQRATGGSADAALARLLVEHSARSTDWLAAAGVQFQPVASGVLPRSRKTAFLLGGGTAMLNRLYAAAEALGVDIRYSCGVTDLKLERGRLAWVDCASASASTSTSTSTRASERTRLRPRAVVVCCGGAQANRAWLRSRWGDAADGFINRGTPHATGEVLHCLLRDGVRAAGDPDGAYLVAVDARSPADDGGIVTRVRCMPAGIVVDGTGRRIHDEGGDTASTRYALWGRRLADCPGQIAHVILDGQGLRGAPPSLYPPLLADDVDALAAALSIPRAALEKTLAEYNAAVRPPAAGDEDVAGWHTEGLTPPKSRHALPLTEPPFGAYPMRPGITFTYHGVAVDADTRVRLEDGGVVENLFAAGMIMAPNLMPRGYLSGLAMSIGVVFGRLAGEEAARHVVG